MQIALDNGSGIVYNWVVGENDSPSIDPTPKEQTPVCDILKKLNLLIHKAEGDPMP